MKINLRLTEAALMLFVCISCSVPKERAVEVSDVDISGYISRYVEVPSGTYIITSDGAKKSEVTITLKLVSTPNEKFSYSEWSGVKMIILDINESTLTSFLNQYQASKTDLKKISELLSGNVGDEKNISFELYADKSILRSIMNNAVSFEIVDDSFSSDEEESTTSSLNTSSISSDEQESHKSSSEWDEILDEFEKYVDKYISCVKKSSDGDLSALSDAAELLESVDKLSDKLENASSELTLSQTARYTKIVTKLTTEAAESLL